MPIITVSNVSKDYKIYKTEKGFVNSLKSIFSRNFEIKNAVNNISLSIEKGELVGYIGSNGAGKSTTIKMLCGILLPTSGEILVNNLIPYKNRQQNALHIGVVFGQRSQLYWDLPMEETFDLYKKMYRIDELQFKRNLEFYIELLNMKEFLRTPVRQLSLGQKMRANLAGALLHDPEIVYLDEPTIGLDVFAKSRIREFLREINKEKKTTILLTTHDMHDIEQICSRIIMIDKGKILYDGSLKQFKSVHSKGMQILVADFENKEIVINDKRLNLIKQEESRKWILFDKEQINAVEAINILTQDNQLIDLNLTSPDIEEIVKNFYDESYK